MLNNNISDEDNVLNKAIETAPNFVFPWGNGASMLNLVIASGWEKKTSHNWHQFYLF